MKGIDVGFLSWSRTRAGEAVVCRDTSSMGGEAVIPTGFDVGPTTLANVPLAGEEGILLADTDRENVGDK